MGKNKLGIYTIFAIGEILLVVIGILIALQINTWDEKRKEVHKEIELIQLLITDLNIKKKENINDLSYGEIWFEQGKRILNYWEEHKDIDTTDFKKVLSRMGGDSWFFSELSPTYIRISNSPLWEKLPDTLSEKVNEIYYSQFTMIKKAFEKSVEYGTHYKLNYLVPNSLIDTEISSIEIKKIIMGNPKRFIGYLRLYLHGLDRLNRRFIKSIELIKALVLDLNAYKNSISVNI